MDAIQGESLQVLRAILPEGPPVVLVDYPAHLNAGDSLIYGGEMAYLRHLGSEVGYVSAVHTHDDDILARLAPDGPILLHGGGNFGDRYPLHQDFREHIISSFRNRRIVQLPQTVDFHDESTLRRTQNVYATHPDLHVLIRDHAGHQRARELFPANNVQFCPDLAFGAGQLTSSAPPRNDVVILKRRDRESNHPDASIPERLQAVSHITDWSVNIRQTSRWWLTTHAEIAAHRFGVLRRLAYPRLRPAFDRRADAIIGNAVATISRGRVVVTDRLHAAIFGALLGKPVVMVDNANHKLSAAHASYLHAFPDVYLARDFNHAADLANTLLVSVLRAAR